MIKSEYIKVRLSKLEKQMLDNYCKYKEINISELVRTLIDKEVMIGVK